MTGPARRAVVLIALGAALLALSYPPFRFPLLSFFALAPAVVLVRELAAATDFRRALRLGFWYGLVSQGLVLYWLVVALWHFTPLSALGYLATIAIYGLWTAGCFWLLVRIRTRFPTAPLWVVFPLVWTAVEWGIGHQGDIRFPWLGLGTSLADAPILVQWADLAGARGVSLWLAWCNVMLVDALLPRRELGAGSGWIGWRPLVAVLGTVVLAWGYGAWRERTLPVRPVGVVGLVQPNEGFREKWNKARQDSVMAHLFALSQRLEDSTHIDLLVWPEAAVPDYFVNRPDWDPAIAQRVRATRTPLVTGGLDAVIYPDRSYDSYNAAFFYDSTGDRTAYPIYRKHYLVPIVERVPFVPPRWFHLRWFGGFGAGRGLPLYPTAVGRLGVLICYESIFADLARDYRRQGADFLVNVTNDAWYGRTAGPYQHLSHLVMRAIETRAGIARAANSGISATVDPLGHVHDASGLEVRTAVASRLATSDVRTVYVRLGDWVGTLAVIATLGFAGLLLVDRWRSRRGGWR
ncbi:MAG: apolipoprotein N-acyltransferase [Gemmatimonadetes bacterium]|nr:MAG: apolipoprotein N-acyltransferase [Gemmatimonadota bacterium]